MVGQIMCVQVRVYPRVCGGAGAIAPGSDPGYIGSIPACAGEPAAPIGPAMGSTRVYPRVCGGAARGREL